MNKKKLLALRTLNATDKMMKMAANQEYKATGYEGRHKEYKYGMFLRCQNLQGILKVSVFFAEEMKKGRSEAHYDIFCNYEGGEWLTLDRTDMTWKTAKIDYLDKPDYAFYSGKWMNPEGIAEIKRCLEVDNGGYRGILTWQLGIREDELKQKHRRETDPWDMKMEQVPELPKDWNNWINKGGCKFHYIFYTYERKGAKTGYCTYCKKEVPISKPKHNKMGTCKKCGKKIEFKSRGKAGDFCTDIWKNCLLQKCEDGVVLRMFRSHRQFYKGRYEEAETTSHEARRVFFNDKLFASGYNYEDYKNTGMRWVEENYFRDYYYGTKGLVYKRTIPNLAKGQLKRTGIERVIKDVDEFDLLEYLDEVRVNPDIELLAKAGLTKVATNLVEGNTKGYPKMKLSGNQRELHKRMGITKEQMRTMVRMHLGAWAWLAYTRHKGIADDVAALLDEWKSDITGYPVFSFTELPVNKLVRYLERQRKQYSQTSKQTLQYYRDYLTMANERGMNLKDDIVRLQPQMMKYHNRYLEEENRKANEKRYAEVNEKFKNIANDYLRNKALFEYQDKKMQIIVPKNASEIVKEGQLQHHCVGSSDTYMRKMNERTSFIVFLRKVQEPTTPYYTIEIKKDAKVLQSYAAYDRQPDIDVVKKFEEKWIAEVNKRMKEEKKAQANAVEDKRAAV